MLTIVPALLGGVGAMVLARAAWRFPVRRRIRGHRTRPGLRVPASLRAPLEHALREAGIAIGPEDAVGITATAAVVAALLTAPISLALVPVAAFAVVIAAPVGLVLARGRAQRAFVAGLAPLVEHVAAQLRGGHTVATALDGAVARGGPVAPDLARLRRRLDLGAPFNDALARWVQERRVAPVRAVAGALAVAADTGGTAAGALDGLARSLRDHLGAHAEAAALSAQARLSAVVVGAAPIGYLVFASAADPGSATMLVTTSAGRICLALGLALDLGAACWMQRILRAEP